MRRFAWRSRVSATVSPAAVAAAATAADGASSACATTSDGDMVEMPMLDDKQHHIVASLMADDEEILSEHGSETVGSGLAVGGSEHTVRLRVHSVEAALCTQARQQLLRVSLTALDAKAAFRDGNVRASATLHSLLVEDPAAPSATPGREIVSIRSAEAPALVLWWVSLTSGASSTSASTASAGTSVTSEASLSIGAPICVAFAPLLFTRIAAFFASVEEVHEALLTLRARAYMRRLMWQDAKREDVRDASSMPPRFPSRGGCGLMPDAAVRLLSECGSCRVVAAPMRSGAQSQTHVARSAMRGCAFTSLDPIG